MTIKRREEEDPKPFHVKSQGDASPVSSKRREGRKEDRTEERK